MTATKNLCRLCRRETNQTIKFTETRSGDPDKYHYSEEYSILVCLGCEEPAFRYTLHDYEGAYRITEDEWEVPTTINRYPAFLHEHKSPDELYLVPRRVREIYEESVQAFRDGAHTLASIGFRATIEAICIDRNILGRNLEKRIEKLAKAGAITQKDCDRLHGIRFLGNDAAHEIIKPDKEALLVVLRIIDHTLQTLYILESLVDGKLETASGDYSLFKDQVRLGVRGKLAGTEQPIQFYLGKQARRFSRDRASLQSKLVEEIKSGTFPELEIGKHAQFAGSKEKVQHFVVPQSFAQQRSA